MNFESVKQDFTLEIAADNGFSILNRIVNVLNRRRVRIKRLLAHEDKGDFHRGGAVLLLHTSSDTIEKLKHQLEKVIEVEQAVYTEGCGLFFDLSERNNAQVYRTKQNG
jgi:acetolactate synthase regulatory subunit